MSDMQNSAETKRLKVQGLTHSYGGKNAIDNVSFNIEAGEIVALLGPSGCGKSTVLRAIAGLIQPKAGRIELGGQDLSVVSARARGIGMVFQNYALFPHLTVAENIAYPLACQQVSRSERKQRVEEMLALVRLSDFGNRLPRELSGGQQQRVAVARAIAGRPASAGPRRRRPPPPPSTRRPLLSSSPTNSYSAAAASDSAPTLDLRRLFFF